MFLSAMKNCRDLQRNFIRAKTKRSLAYDACIIMLQKVDDYFSVSSAISTIRLTAYKETAIASWRTLFKVLSVFL